MPFQSEHVFPPGPPGGALRLWIFFHSSPEQPVQAQRGLTQGARGKARKEPG